MTDFKDEFSGQGGSYIADPETGKRTLIERTQEPTTATEQPAPAAEQPDSLEGN